MQGILTQNAIIHMSVGFQGPFIMQVFCINRILDIDNYMRLCLTDGMIYVGAKYNPSKYFELQNYWVVKVTCKFINREQPIIIKTLSVCSQIHQKLMGSVPCTLTDYFNEQILKQPTNTSNKKIKINTEGHINLASYYSKIKNQPLRIPKQDNSNNCHNLSKHFYQPIMDKPSQQQNKKTVTKKLQLASQEQSVQSDDYMKPQKQRQQQMYWQYQNNKMQKKQAVDKRQNKEIITCRIKQLFQHNNNNWYLLCRVNYISMVQCSNGFFAVNFVLMDEYGDDIKCVYFESSIQKASQLLKLGQWYYFSNGQLKQKEKQQQITFDRNSFVQVAKNVKFSISNSSIKKIDKIVDYQHKQQISVIGIVRRIKTRDKLKSKLKLTSTICDPISQLQIDFMLFLNRQDIEIQIGMVIVLHNFQTYRSNNIFRLNSTYSSYYSEQKGIQGDQAYELCQFMIKNPLWKDITYKNISMFTFTQRTLNDLSDITRKTEDEKIYSSIDCWILDISKKKSYCACIFCKKSIEKQKNPLENYCNNCNKEVETILTYTLSVTFTDYTGSCLIDVIGEHAEKLLEMKANQFNSMRNDEQNNHLELLKFKNIQLRLKTERKNNEKKVQRKQSQSVWGIDKVNCELTLREIKKKLSYERIKLQDRW